MFGYFYGEFIDFIFKDKSLTDFKNSFSPNNFRNNDRAIRNYFLK